MIGISAFFVFYEETDKGIVFSIVFSNEYDKKEPKELSFGSHNISVNQIRNYSLSTLYMCLIRSRALLL